MRKSHSKLLSTLIIAISAFAFAGSVVAASGDPNFNEGIINTTNNFIYITPTSHYEVHHPSRFKIVVKPFGYKNISFSVALLSSDWGPYINQHISAFKDHLTGKGTKCFQIRFETGYVNGSKIESCGAKNDMFLVHKTGSGANYVIYIYKKVSKLK